MKLLAPLLVLLCLALLAFGHGHEFENTHGCIHDIMNAANKKRNTLDNPTVFQVYTNASGYPASDFPTKSNTKPIRIKLDLRYLDNDPVYTCYNVNQTIIETDDPTKPPNTVYGCTQRDILTAAARTYLINTLLTNATFRLAQLFQVVPVVGPLLVTSGACSKAGVNVPTDYTLNGVPNTDLLVFVTTRPTPSFPNILAYASSCQDDQYHRSIVGIINITPASISTDIGLIMSQTSTVKHELTHVLGLTSAKYNLFRAPGSSTPYNAMITDANGINYINSSQVLSFTRSYYACSTALGAQLEDGGGITTEASHWEKSMWMNEYMTGMTVRDPVMSNVTLAYFMDSGWYYTNYNQAEVMLWGYHDGCNFLTPCPGGWPSGNGYSCSSSSTDNQCTFDLMGKGDCTTDSLTGTTCPYIRGYDDGWCIDPTETGVKIPLVNTGEEFATNSRCFQSSLLKHVPVGKNQLVCYKTACVAETDMRVMVEGFWYTCLAGQTTAVKDYGGVINCPDPTRVCLDAPDNTASWPSLQWISPDSGEPGTTITLTGQNFDNVTEVYIAGYCTNLIVVNNSTIVVTLPTYDNIDEFQNLLTSEANVYIVNSQGFNSFDWKKFELKVTLSKALLRAIGRWLKKHWYVPLIIGFIILALVLACWCCHRDSIGVREKRFQKQQRWEMHQIENKQKVEAKKQADIAKRQFDQQYDGMAPRPKYAN